MLYDLTFVPRTPPLSPFFFLCFQGTEGSYRQPSIMLSPEHSVPAKVAWRREERHFTDKPCAYFFGLCLVLFLGFGFALVASSHATYSSTAALDATLDLSPYYAEAAATCCSSLAGNPSWTLQEGGVCSYVQSKDGRHLTSGSSSSNFPSAGGVFDAFSLHPEIPTTLIGMTVFLAFLWIALLRVFATRKSEPNSAQHPPPLTSKQC